MIDQETKEMIMQAAEKLGIEIVNIDEACMIAEKGHRIFIDWMIPAYPILAPHLAGWDQCDRWGKFMVVMMSMAHTAVFVNEARKLMMIEDCQTDPQ